MVDKRQLGTYREFQLTAFPRERRGFVVYAVRDLLSFMAVPREAVALIASSPSLESGRREIRERIDRWWTELEVSLPH